MAQSQRLYFGYGSNMWLEQMAHRCPESQYFGTAHLIGWKWIIGERGYANIVPSEDGTVYGLVYEISVEDEQKLDRYEGVPLAYQKKELKVILSEEGNVNAVTREVEVLVYVDVERTGETNTHEEYFGRMDKAVGDAFKKGIQSNWKFSIDKSHQGNIYWIEHKPREARLFAIRN